MSMQQQNFNDKMLSFGSRTLRMLLQSIVYEHAALKHCLDVGSRTSSMFVQNFVSDHAAT